MRVGPRSRAAAASLVLAAAAGAFAPRLAAQTERLGPDGQEAAPRDSLPGYVRSGLSLYRRPPRSEAVRGVLDRWARDGGPASVSDSVAAAALWRRAARVRDALGALPASKASDALRPRVELERARILLQAAPQDSAAPGTHEERRVEGGAAFWRACEQLDPETAGELWLDLRGLATPEEQREWSALPRDARACPWVRRLVEERAWRMVVSPEERLQIHYARLREARDRYWLRKPRFTRDMTDRLGRPEGLELDDRGLVYLRMGAPDADVAPPLGLNESWAYFRPGAPRVFHFAPVSRTGLLALADFRMLENLAHASGLTMPSELAARGGGGFSYLYRSRRVLDFLFEESVFAMMDRRLRVSGDRFNPNFMGFLAWERRRNEADARHAVQTVPDVPELSPGVLFAYETLRFRAPAGDMAEIWVLASARAGDLTAGPPTGEGRLAYAVGAELGLMTPDGLRRLGAENRPVVDDPLQAEDGLPVRLRLELPPGRYPYTLVVRDRQARGDAIGNWAQDTLGVPTPIAGLPELSDLAVAADSGGSWTRDGLTFLRVDPTHVVGPRGAAHVYFEVYGSPPATPYEVEVRVVPDSAAERIYELEADDLAFTLRFPSEMPPEDGTPGRHHFRLDLADSPPGAYLLAVRVTDRRSGVSSLPAVTPLYRPRADGAHWTEGPRRRSTIVRP